MGHCLRPARLQEVTRKEAEAYAASIGALFVETSAKEATNVEDVFVKIGAPHPTQRLLAVCPRSTRPNVRTHTRTHLHMTQQQESACQRLGHHTMTTTRMT